MQRAAARQSFERAVGDNLCARGARPGRRLLRAVLTFADGARLAGSDPDDLVLSPLDDHTLHLLEAASPLLTQDHLAELLETAPTTGLGLRVDRVDTQGTRQVLTRLLKPYDSDRRRRLMKDLLRTSVLRDVELSPAAHVLQAPRARDLLRAKLRDDIRHGAPAAAAAAAVNEVCDPADVRAAVARIAPLAAKHARLIRWLAGADLSALDDSTFEQLLVAAAIANTKERPILGPQDAIAHLAANERVPPRLLDRLSRAAAGEDAALPFELDPSTAAATRAALTSNRACTASSLERLATSALDAKSKTELVCNPATPEPLRTELETERYFGLLGRALRDELPEEGYRELCSHQEVGHLFTRRRFPAHLPDALAPWVHLRHARYLLVIAPLTAAGVRALRDRAAGNEDGYDVDVERSAACPPDLLREVAASDEVWRHAAVARHPNLPPDLREWVRSNEPEELLKSHLLRPEDLADGTLQLADDKTRKGLLSNPKVRSGELALPAGSLDGVDAHVLHEAATAQDAPAIAVESRAEAAILGSYEALTKMGIPHPERTPKRWDDLPSTKDVAFELPPVATKIATTPICGLQAIVALDGRDLDRFHRLMGNCLDTFLERALRNEVVVAIYPDPAKGQCYAAAWDVHGNHLSLIEVNARNNVKEAVPPEFDDAIHDFTHQLPRTVGEPRAFHSDFLQHIAASLGAPVKVTRRRTVDGAVPPPSAAIEWPDRTARPSSATEGAAAPRAPHQDRGRSVRRPDDHGLR